MLIPGGSHAFSGTQNQGDTILPRIQVWSPLAPASSVVPVEGHVMTEDTTRTTNDTSFTGSIPAAYEQYLVPFQFEPYAKRIAAAVASLAPARVLETAAGTGVVTRELARVLPSSASLTATDINPAMIEVARSSPVAENVRWQSCDATRLPFDDNEFDVVVTQFGVMFFPDKHAAFHETRRVLRQGGAFVFLVWDSLEHNATTRIAGEAINALFPNRPISFLRRVPFGYHDIETITRHLLSTGFEGVATERVALTGHAPSALHIARGLCQGTPLRGELTHRDPGSVEAVTGAVADALEKEFGDGAVTDTLQAILVTARS